MNSRLFLSFQIQELGRPILLGMKCGPAALHSELQLGGGTSLFSSPKLQVRLKDVGLRIFFQMNSPPAEHLLEKKSKTFPHFSCGCQFFLRSPFFQAPSGEMHRKTLTPGGFWKECRSLRQRKFFHFLNNQ